jgi:anthranilate phosphoribosyltransferase
VVEVIGDEVRRYAITPQQVGLRPALPEDVPGGDPTQNADTARRIFAGAAGASRDLAVLNAGAAIYAGGGADSVEEGVRVAERSVDSGAAQAALERFVNRTRELMAGTAGASSGAGART